MRLLRLLAFLSAASIGSLCEASQPPIFTPPPPPQTVTFGTNVTDGAPFSVQLTATSTNFSDVLNLYLGALPAGVYALSVAGVVPARPRSRSAAESATRPTIR